MPKKDLLYRIDQRSTAGTTATGVVSGSIGSGGGTVAPHALNDQNVHTGPLSEAQAPWAVTDTEFLAHTTNINAHHHIAVSGAGIIADANTQELSISLSGSSGLVLTDDELAIGTPLPVTAISTNFVSDVAHTHAVTASSNGATSHNTITKFSSTGGLAMSYATTPLLNTSTGDMSISPAGNLLFFPVGESVLMPSDKALGSTVHVPGLLGQGWRISERNGVAGLSHLDIRSIYSDELFVTHFTADTVRVRMGQDFLTFSMGLVSKDNNDNYFVTPAVGASVRLYVEDSPDVVGPLFGDGEWVMLSFLKRGANGEEFISTMVWGQVASYIDEVENRQSWLFTNREGLSGLEIGPGALALGFGSSGAGYIHRSVVDPDSPFLRFVTWSGANPYTPANRTVWVQVGNLNGIDWDATLNPTGWGLYAQNVFLNGDIISGGGVIRLLKTSGLNLQQDTWGAEDDRRAIQWWEDIDYPTGLPTLAIYASKSTTAGSVDYNFAYLRATPSGGKRATLTLGADKQGGVSTLNGSYINLLGGSAAVGNQGQITLDTDVIFFEAPTAYAYDFLANNLYHNTTTGPFNIGSAGSPWSTLYVDTIVANNVVGGTALSGQVWQYDSGDMYIRSTHTGLRTLYVANPGAGVMNLNVDGALTVGGNIVTPGSVDGVDVSTFYAQYSAHAADTNIHHAKFIALKVDNNATVTPDPNGAIKLVGGAGLTTTAGTNIVDLTLNLLSTGGLAFSGDSLAVNAGDGITVSSAVAVNMAALVDSSYGLTVVSNDVRINLLATGGLAFSSGKLTVNAGDGLLAGAALSVRIATNSGLVFSSGALTMGVPATLSATSTNGLVFDTHSHAISATDDPGATASILRSSASGGLILQSLGVEGAATITGGDLTVGANILFVNESVGNVGINRVPDVQFDLDVYGNARVGGYFVGKHAIQLDHAKMIVHFDAGDGERISAQGTPTGHLGQPATLAGNVLYGPGKFGGKSLQVAPSFTPVATFSFEDDLQSWNVYYSTTSIAQNEDYSVHGGYCVRGEGAGDINGAIRSDFITVSPSTTYTVSAYLRSGYSTQLVVMEYDAVNATVATRTAGQFTPDGWERQTMTFTTMATTNKVRIMVYHYNLPVGAYVYADAVQLIQSSYSTPFTDQVTHTRDFIDYAAPGIINPAKGTFMAWVKPDAFTATSSFVMATGIPGATARIYLYMSQSAQMWGVNIGDTTPALVAPVSIREWAHLVLTWDGSLAKLYVDGALAQSIGYTGMMDTPGGTLRIGNNLSGTTPFNGWIDEVAFLDRVMDADEVVSIYESDAPVFAETSVHSFRVGSGLFWGDDDGFFGLDTDGTPIVAMVGVDGKSWGGSTLDKGDVQIGSTSTGYIKFDRSTQLVSLVDVDLSIYDGLTKAFGVSKAGGVTLATTTLAGGTPEQNRTISWYDGTDYTYTLYAQTTSTVDNLNIRADVANAKNKTFEVNVFTDSPKISTVRLVADNYSASAELKLTATSTLETAVIQTAYALFSIYDSNTLHAIRLFAPNGVGINTAANNTTPNAALNVIQSDAAATKPVLRLEQLNAAEEFIEFRSASLGVGNPVDTQPAGAYYGRARVSVNGTYKYVHLYNP